MNSERITFDDVALERALALRASMPAEEALMSAIRREIGQTRQSRSGPRAMDGIISRLRRAGLDRRLVAVGIVALLVLIPVVATGAGLLRPPVPARTLPQQAPPTLVLGVTPPSAPAGPFDDPGYPCTEPRTGNGMTAASAQPVSVAGLDGGYGAYLAGSPGGLDLWIAVGAQPSVRLAQFNGKASSISGTLSADTEGRWIDVLLRGSADGRECSDVYVVDLKSGSMTRLFADRLIVDAILAPAADRLAVAASRKDGTEILTLGLSDGIEHSFVCPSWAGMIAWSAGGDRIAAVCDGQVSLMDTATGVSRDLATAPGPGENRLAWTDDEQLLFVRKQDGIIRDAVINPVTGAAGQEFSTGHGYWTSGPGRSMQISRDGHWGLAYIADTPESLDPTTHAELIDLYESKTLNEWFSPRESRMFSVDSSSMIAFAEDSRRLAIRDIETGHDVTTDLPPDTVTSMSVWRIGTN